MARERTTSASCKKLVIVTWLPSSPTSLPMPMGRIERGERTGTNDNGGGKVREYRCPARHRIVPYTSIRKSLSSAGHRAGLGHVRRNHLEIFDNISPLLFHLLKLPPRLTGGRSLLLQLSSPSQHLS